MIQAIVCEPVFTSGVGMSRSGPINRLISVAYLRVRPWRSLTDRRRGLTTTPPMAPPHGTSSSAAFQVLSMALARTRSRVRSCV